MARECKHLNRRLIDDVRASLGQLFRAQGPLKLRPCSYQIMLYVAVAGSKTLTKGLALRLAIGVCISRQVWTGRQQPRRR